MDSVRTGSDRPAVDGVEGTSAPWPGSANDAFPATLCEDSQGRLVVFDARRAPDASVAAAPLMRIGRLRIALHHLGPSALAQLAAQGHATLDASDALSVLLAFAESLRRGNDGS